MHLYLNLLKFSFSVEIFPNNESYKCRFSGYPNNIAQRDGDYFPTNKNTIVPELSSPHILTGYFKDYHCIRTGLIEDTAPKFGTSL